MRVERPESDQPLPPNAKRVFQGAVFDVYQWEQKMFDGTTATFEKLKRPDTVVVVPVTDDGRLILIEEEQPGTKPCLTFPAGRLEPNENPAAGALRELLEETGYAPATSVEGLALWHAEQPVTKLDWAVYVFVARGCRKMQEMRADAGERISERITTFEDAAALARDGQLGERMAIAFLRAELDKEEMRKTKELFGLI